MTAIHEVLRYLLARVPHSTQADLDRVAALIDADDPPAPAGTEPAPEPAPANLADLLKKES